MITQTRTCCLAVLTILAMGVACNVHSGANGRDGGVAGTQAVGGSAGATLPGGSGGSSSSGGNASAGSPGSAGQVGSGGSSATGGAVTTGGIKGTGGNMATGAVMGSGGRSATAGAVGSGGAPAGGGNIGRGGVNGFGGASAAAGGKGGSGGNSGGGVSGSGGGTGGTGGTGGSAGASVQALATAYCAAARNCCFSTDYWTPDLTDCEAKFPVRLKPLALVDKGTVIIDKTALAACIAAYNQTATACTLNNLAPACRGVFVGTKAEGEPCGYGGDPTTGGTITEGVHECKASGGPELCVWTGDMTVSGATGTCHKPPHGKIGDPCIGSCQSGDEWLSDTVSLTSVLTVCFEDDGLYCRWGSNFVCAPIVANGGDCTDDSACASTSFCDSKTKTCMTAGTLGQSCAANALQCSHDLACGANNQCTEPIFGVFGSEGDPHDCSGLPPVPN